MRLIDAFRKAQQVSTPVVAVETSDQPRAFRVLREYLSPAKPPEDFVPSSLFAWDILTGLRPLNDLAKSWVPKLGFGEEDLANSTGSPAEFLQFFTKFDLPEFSVIFAENFDLYLQAPPGSVEPILQGLISCRDTFKERGITLVLLGTSFDLPPTVAQDIVVLEDPLPQNGELEDIVRSVIADARACDSRVKEPSAKQIKQTAIALRGLSPFAAEQVTALALTRQGIDFQELWVRKSRFVENTKGLKFAKPQFGYSDVGGLANIKEFLLRLFTGNRAPALIVFIDEIEKAMAGSSGPQTESSGVSSDQLGVLLNRMQSNEWTGMIFIGHPGTGKSFMAEVAGKEFSKPVIHLDLGATKGQYVGQSEARIRESMRVLEAVGEKDVLFIATCNRIESLPPELRRRFSLGTWFFDLPTSEERESIWNINLKRFQIKETKQLPQDEGWTGAEIRNCCDIASRLAVSPKDAASYVVPVSVADPKGIEALQTLADGRFLSASFAGVYRKDRKETEASGGRKPRRAIRV